MVRTILNEFDMKNWLLFVLSSVFVLGLASCGGGGSSGLPENSPTAAINPNVIPDLAPVVNPSPNPSPGAAVTPTVTFVTPASDVYFTGGMNVKVAVTGAPDKVELYKNGVLEGIMAAPLYEYYWQNGSEPEGVYTLTAKAIKAGTADVVSSARVVTVDRTNPELVSRLPADGAANVQRTDEISVTMSEPILASTVNSTTVRLFVGGVEVGSSAMLDATGKKIRIAFNVPPALPATVTVAIRGLTDLAGRLNYTIADSSFVMGAAPAGAPKVILSFTTDRLTTITPGRANPKSHTALINLQNFTAGPKDINYSALRVLMVNNSVITVFSSDVFVNTPDCPIGVCFTIDLAGKFDSFNNGSLNIRARVKLKDDTFIFSPEVPLLIAISNLESNFPIGWSIDPDGVGVVKGTPKPTSYTPILDGRELFGLYNFGPFFSHQEVASAGTITYRKTYNIQSIYNTQDGEFYYKFKAITDTIGPGSTDAIYGGIRACQDAEKRFCTVWNTFISTGGSGIRQGPPNLGVNSNTPYVEVYLTFDSQQGNSPLFIGNMFFGF
jgi:Bacterial Ig-like domain/Bacterial Ig domain